MRATLRSAAVVECERVQVKVLVRVMERQWASASLRLRLLQVEGRFAAVPLAAGPSSAERETGAQCGNRPGE